MADDDSPCRLRKGREGERFANGWQILSENLCEWLVEFSAHCDNTLKSLQFVFIFSLLLSS